MEMLLSAVSVAAVAVVLIETVLLPGEREVARIPDDETERAMKNRFDD
ncbi:MAG: hypothetical protein RLZ25_2129 [Pseudomonadota bacterium]|jgi:hypothetical protein